MKKSIKLGLCSMVAILAMSSNAFAKSGGTHWGYQGDEAPSKWGTLDSKFAKCSTGNEQTPIDIKDVKDVDLKPLKLDYKFGSKDIVNNGHTIQVNMDNGNTFNIDGTDYKLLQFHFHTPSENNIMGKSFPLEAHFVHASKDGNLAVIGVMFKDGSTNPTIEKIWNNFPKKLNTKEALSLSANDVKSLMSDTKDYYKFMGSLTTPPCSENVKWFVLKKPLSISKEQVERFFKLYNHSNNRPIQKTNGRKILG